MNAPCPRCQTSLRPVQVGESHLSGCSQCGGVWLDPYSLGAVLKACCTETLRVADDHQGQQLNPASSAPLPCPSCRKPLDRLFLGNSQVEVDRCSEHGTWFDAGELRAAAENAKKNTPTLNNPALAVAGVGLGAAALGQANNQRTSDAVAGGVEMAAEVAMEAAEWVDPETAVEVGGGLLEITLGILGGLLSG